MRPFFRGPTRAVDLTASLLGGLGYTFGTYLVQPALRFITPAGQKLFFASPEELQSHIVLARFTLAALPLLGWILASVKTARSGTPSGLAQYGLYTAPILAAAAAAGLARMLMERHLWLEAARGPLEPMVAVAELGPWSWALKGGVLMFAVLLFRLWRRK